MKYLKGINELFGLFSKKKVSDKTEFIDKVGRRIVDPLDFIASNMILSDRRVMNTFHQYLDRCEDIIKRDGYITDYEVIGVGIVGDYLENKPVMCDSRICKIYNYILYNKLKGDTNFYKA